MKLHDEIVMPFTPSFCGNIIEYFSRNYPWRQFAQFLVDRGLLLNNMNLHDVIVRPLVSSFASDCIKYCTKSLFKGRNLRHFALQVALQRSVLLLR
jgi:hypothetical protein